MPSHPPEAPQQADQGDGLDRILTRHQAVERRSQVVMVEIEPLQPRCLIGSANPLLRPFGHLYKIAGMTLPEGGLFSTRRKALERVFPQRLEHPEPGLLP